MFALGTNGNKVSTLCLLHLEILNFIIKLVYKVGKSTPSTIRIKVFNRERIRKYILYQRGYLCIKEISYDGPLRHYIEGKNKGLL